MFGFDFGLKEVIDILLTAFLMYEVFQLLRKTGSKSLLLGIMGFVLSWFLVCYVFELELLGGIFDRIISVGALAVVIIFQEEIRGFLMRIGTQFSNFRFRFRLQADERDRIAQEIVLACNHMSKTKTGALIVIAQKQDLTDFINTGEVMECTISARIVENIFFKNTPLHDGALFISGARIVSAAAILPVSKNPNIPKQYGLRHRAALGLAERTDAVVIVVSEETGKISVARNAEVGYVTQQELGDILLEIL